MQFDRTGIILYTIRFKECVDFYANVLELKTMFIAENLVCFEFGKAYLMVELDDQFTHGSDRSFRTRTCLRMNVEKVRFYADLLSGKGIDVDYQVHEWGTIAKFKDPDGNLCAFKDSKKFEKQVEG